MTLVERLLELHQQGTLHIMDRGQICVGCGGQWPCRSIQIINDEALKALTSRS